MNMAALGQGRARPRVSESSSNCLSSNVFVFLTCGIPT